MFLCVCVWGGVEMVVFLPQVVSNLCESVICPPQPSEEWEWEADATSGSGQSFLKKKIGVYTYFDILFYVFECSACMCIYAPCLGLVPKEGQMRPSEPPELELQMVVSRHVGAGNRAPPRSSERAASALGHWAISPAPGQTSFKEWPSGPTCEISKCAIFSVLRITQKQQSAMLRTPHPSGLFWF